MPETLCDYLSRITDENTVINICDKDNTILCCNKFKDMRLIEICDYLGQDVIEVQKFYNEKDKNTIYYITIDKSIDK